MLKNYESICISRMNYTYSNGYAEINFKAIDLNSIDAERAVEKITKLIEALL